jgi:hypothetical protein
VGLSWAACGLLYLAVLTRGFTKAPPAIDWQAEDEADLRDTAAVPEN